jgi:hypothetical protein
MGAHACEGGSVIERIDESGLFSPVTAADIEDAMEVAEEYAKREIEERLTAHDFSADDADWQGYSSQWKRR